MIAPVHPALVRLALRQCLARRRWMILVILAALPVVLAFGVRVSTGADDPVRLVTQVLSTLIVTGVVPVVGLLLANAALGSEVDDGTLVYLLTKPLPRWQIVTSKLFTAALLAVAVTAGTTLVSSLIALGGSDPSHLAAGFATGVAVGAVLYTAVFLALSLITRRGMLVGLIYLIVWEGAFSGFFAGTRTFSIRQYILSIADAITTVDPDEFTALLPFGTAWPMAIAVALGALLLSVSRLRRFELDKTG